MSGGTLSGTLTLPDIYITGTASSLPSHYYHYLYGDSTDVYEHFGTNSDRNKVTYGHFRFFDGNGSYKTLILGGDSTFNWDGHTVLTEANFNYYAPTLTGAGASGTWGINISGNANTATDADTLDGYHASSLVKFYLSPIEASAPADSAKSWFINTMPSASSAIIYNVPGSEKTIIAGKSSGSYGHMLQLNYDDNYLRILRYSAGTWKTDDWEKISAGHADTATVATTATTAINDGNGNVIASTYLPLSGGELTGTLIIRTTSDRKLILDNIDDENWSLISFRQRGEEYGYLGIQGDSDLKWNNAIVLHSANYNSYAPTLTGTGATGT